MFRNRYFENRVGKHFVTFHNLYNSLFTVSFTDAGFFACFVVRDLLM